MNMTQPVGPQLVKLFLERLRSGAEEEQLQAATQLSRLQIRSRGTVRTRGSLARSAGSPYAAELGREAMQSVLAALQHESPAVRKEVMVVFQDWI